MKVESFKLAIGYSGDKASPFGLTLSYSIESLDWYGGGDLKL